MTFTRRAFGALLVGATRDLSRRLVYSVNTLHMGGTEQPEVAQKIIAAALT